jgi:hypothetical protein
MKDSRNNLFTLIALRPKECHTVRGGTDKPGERELNEIIIRLTEAMRTIRLR